MNKYSILVVEDEALIAANLVQTLTSLGYTVHKPVATGEDAIRAVKTQHPDLVLMDIKLIGAMDGIEAAEKIRAIADIPIVYLTAYTDNLRLKKAQLTEPYGYIVKPTHSRELHATIEMAMYKHALDLKLKESEAKYRTVFENTGTAMVILEENNIISIANKEFEQLTGFSKDDIEGKKRWTEFVVKEDLERMLAQHRLRMQNPEKALTHYEFRAVIKSGDIRTLYVSIELIPGTTKSVASLMDITERKRAEEALQIQYNLAIALTTCHTMKEALELILDAAFHDKSLDSGGIYVVDPVTGALELVVHRAIPPEFVGHMSHFDADAPQVLRAKTGTPFYGQYGDIRQPGKDEIRDREGVTALASIPVLHKGNLIAIMNMASHIHDDIPIPTRKLLEMLATQISGALVYIRSEEALRESENLFRSVGDSLLDPVLILSSEGVVQFTNRAAIQFIGLPDTAIIRGQSFTTYLDGDSRNRVITDLHTIQYLGGPLTAEYCVNPAKGEQRWVEACGVRIDYKGSHATLITLHDITERIRVEEVLRGSERQLADIISFLPDATLVIDKNGTVLAWNRAMEKMTGVPAEQMIGKANYEYALPFYHERRPITIDLVLHDDPSVVAKYPVMKKEGRSRRSEIFIPHLNEGRGAHLWFTASPLFDTAGNLMGAIESIRDITEHKQAEEALRKSEERYHNVVEDQTEFICRFLPDGTHIFVNDSYCRYFDKKREEIIGHRFRPVLHPEDREIVAQHLTSITPEHPVLNIDQRIIMPDGSTRWQRWSDRAIFGENGRVIEYQSVGRDITEQKRVQEALQRVNKQLNLLASITRHDILNQLLVLKGYIELSRDYLDDKQTLGDFLEKEEKAARTIEEQITFTRDYQELGVAAPEWQNVNEGIRKAMIALPLRAVHIEPDPADPEVYADLLFEKVFYNLIDNALCYGGDQMKMIRVSSQESDTHLMIVCEDDGVGIADEDKKKLFRKGFGKHTGLGLFLSREILGITGITITENGIPGKGARFEIAVPKGMWRMKGASA